MWIEEWNVMNPTTMILVIISYAMTTNQTTFYCIDNIALMSSKPVVLLT